MALAVSVALAAARLVHIYACENDRGVPGRGQVAWADVAPS